MILSNKEEITKQIIKVLKKALQKCDNTDGVNPSVITQTLGWDKVAISNVCNLFGVSKFGEILSQIPQLKIEKNEHGTTYVQLVQNTEHTQLNAKQEETKMAETTKHHDRIATLKNALGEGLYEKDAALRLALLAAIAGESIFFLGAPGCAKSMLARRIAQAFKADGDGSLQYFETLLNQFSTPEDVFGNISLKALNGEGESGKEEYRRLTENMLPEADIAFLDEICKASPAILNTLLTIINERKFHNGSTVQDVPLKALLAASNELPAKDRGLEALYDRFIIRLPIGFIQNEDTFFDMVAGSSSEFELSDEIKKLQISNAELEDWKTQIDAVQLSEEARAVISAIRKELTAQNAALSEEEKAAGEAFAIGDRRWKKIVRILKTSAFLNDRTEVDLMDCQLIEYCIWNTEKQQKKAREIVEKCIQQNGLDCNTAIDDIKDGIKEFEKIVTERFYTHQENKPAEYEMKDGYRAYKIVKPSSIQSYSSIVPHYLCPEYNHSGYSRNGAYYDQNCNFLGDYDFYFRASSFKIDGNTAHWIDGCRGNSYSAEIECTSDEIIKNPTVFKTPDLLELRRTKTDSENYLPIKNTIDSEIKKLDAFIQSKSEIYKANVFADTVYFDIIMAAVIEAKKELQDAQVNLDKQRARYQ